MNRKDEILRHYEPRINAGLENYEVLDWASQDSQEARFSVLVKSVDLSGLSLLDIGCGLGDLLDFLTSRSISINYTGVDISEKMLAAAQKRHPDTRFVCGDLFSDTPQATAQFPDDSYDIVFCSGALNLNLGNNALFLPKAVASMRRLARKCLVFNLLHMSTPDHSGRYASYDPATVLSNIQSPNWQDRLVEGYLPNDFTIICSRLPNDR